MKVLFVDDEADIRELVEIAVIVEDDIEAHFASSGQEAIDRIVSERFDIVMLDVMMPPPDGLEVLRMASEKAALDDATVVMCTAKTSVEAEREFRELGAHHVLHKPFKPLKLAGYLRSL